MLICNVNMKRTKLWRKSKDTHRTFTFHSARGFL